MDIYEQKIKEFIKSRNIQAEHICFSQSCHSVAEAAAATGAAPEDFVKNICLIDNQNNLIVAIVKGEDRASTKRVAKALNIGRPRTATTEEILIKTGYPCGGTPSFSYIAIFLIDQRVMEKEVVYSGGGSENSLIKIATEDLQKANKGRVCKISK